MKKLASTLSNMILSLGLICVVAGAALASVNTLTKGPIAKAKAMKIQEALTVVLPAFENKPSEETLKVGLAPEDSLLVYPAMKGGKLIGAAIESTSKKGFNGEIKVLVGIDTHGKLIDYSVLKQADTPGLGTKMVNWFRNADKPNQYIVGKDLSIGELTVSKDQGTVDGITAATISSRAFLETINRAYKAFTIYQSSAQTQP